MNDRVLRRVSAETGAATGRSDGPVAALAAISAGISFRVRHLLGRRAGSAASGPETPTAPSGALETGESRPPDIRAESLCKTYRVGETELEILRNIDLAIRPGEFVAVMGPSGSGKSTLLYLLGGLDRPSSGRVSVKGRDIGLMNDEEASRMRRRDVGFVFQFYNLVPNLTVEENILLPLLLDGGETAGRNARLEELLDLVGLADRRRHTPRELSGGQQQRVAIARSLMNSPDIILADEPTGNLDSHSGEGIMDLLAAVNREEGRTIVMVTHSRPAAEHAGRLLTMMDGQIASDEEVK